MRRTRYQGAIIKDNKILLILHKEHEAGRSYWVMPGGGREMGETEIACVVREMWEETNLEVSVKRLLFETSLPHEYTYATLKTYLCHVVSGQASPGYEPEEEAAALYAIAKVAWFDLRSEENWEASLIDDPFTYPVLQEVRRELGYM